jgi:acyl-CoA thioesterase-2
LSSSPPGAEGVDIDRDIDVDAVVADTIEHLTLEPSGDGWVGRTPAWFGDVLFGGFVIAQAIAAVCVAAPKDRRLHSMHAYFLRPVLGSSTVSYQCEVLRDGRTFSSRSLRAEQDGKPVLAMSASFTADTQGYDYDLGGLGADVPGPDLDNVGGGPGPWESCWVGPAEPDADGSRQSTHRMWFRIPTRLPDEPHLHAALLGFATDWTGIGGRPLHLDGDTTGMVSVDHAAWFHRPARADQWLFYDVQSLVNAGGRGLLRGVMRDEDGHVVASAAQEMLLRVI